MNREVIVKLIMSKEQARALLWAVERAERATEELIQELSTSDEHSVARAYIALDVMPALNALKYLDAKVRAQL